jgi:hypothetical protein
VADMLAWCRWFIEHYSEVPEWTALPGGPLFRNVQDPMPTKIGGSGSSAVRPGGPTLLVASRP